MIRFVVLDLGGVVCRFDPDSRLRAFERLTGRSAAEIHAAIFESGLERQSELGEIDPLTLRSLLLAALDANIDAETLRAGWSLAFDPDDKVLALIDRLAVPAVLFTNNGPMVDSCLDHELFRVRGVDDSPENVAAARDLGWHGEVFTDVATLEQQLDEVGAFKSA